MLIAFLTNCQSLLLKKKKKKNTIQTIRLQQYDISQSEPRHIEIFLLNGRQAINLAKNLTTTFYPKK